MLDELKIPPRKGRPGGHCQGQWGALLWFIFQTPGGGSLTNSPCPSLASSYSKINSAPQQGQAGVGEGGGVHSCRVSTFYRLFYPEWYEQDPEVPTHTQDGTQELNGLRAEALSWCPLFRSQGDWQPLLQHSQAEGQVELRAEPKRAPQCQQGWDEVSVARKSFCILS